MLQVKLQFGLFNLSFFCLIVLDGLRLYFAISGQSKFVQICLESSYHIVVFGPVIYVLIMHHKINKERGLIEERIVK